MIASNMYDVFDKSRKAEGPPANQVGKLPNGDLLIHNPDDDYVYQVDQINQVVLSPFCSIKVWHSTYKPLLEQASKEASSRAEPFVPGTPARA